MLAGPITHLVSKCLMKLIALTDTYVYMYMYMHMHMYMYLHVLITIMYGCHVYFRFASLTQLCYLCAYIMLHCQIYLTKML